MAELKSLPLAKIFVPERLRAVEEDHALAISASIVEHGLINPITVRATPRRAATPYTLVAGAHRYRAIELLDDPEIDCVVVEGDAEEAQLIEITENLFRNDLSVMDRAIFVATYREVWERKYGKIEAGRLSARNRSNLVRLIGDEGEKGFSRFVADRLGVSPSSFKRLNVIAQGLLPSLRTALRGTPEADNQSRLIQLAKLEPEKQRQFVTALNVTGGDFEKALAVIDDHGAIKPTRDQKFVSTLMSTWERITVQARRTFLTEHLDEGDQRAVYATLKAKFEGDEA